MTHQTPLSDTQIAEWRNEGALLFPNFFSSEEIAPLHTDFAKVYALEPIAPTTERDVSDNHAENGQFHVDQVEAIRGLPAYKTPTLNMFRLHPKMLGAVKQLLGTPDIRIYANYIWEKHAGMTDYSQAFHLDYPTHQLLVPSDDARMGTVNCFIYVTDVHEGNGPLNYVRHQHADGVNIHQAQPGSDVQKRFEQYAESATAPAGSVIFYTTSTYHRGTNLIEEGSIRKVIGLGFRRADQQWVAAPGGQFHAMMPQWRETFALADVEQLCALGVPEPGHAYWTEYTIKGTENRYPEWNSIPYRDAIGMPARIGTPPEIEWPSVEDVIDKNAINALFENLEITK